MASTPATQAQGLLLRRCRLQREREVPDASVALGRPWRPTRSFADGRYGDPAVRGSAAFVDCWMDAHIDANGWDAMSYTARDGSRVKFEPGDGMELVATGRIGAWSPWTAPPTTSTGRCVHEAFRGTRRTGRLIGSEAFDIL